MSTMETEGHLGGYIVNGIEKGTYSPILCRHLVSELQVHSVLDLGCGLGYVMELYRSIGCHVLGVDGSPSAVVNNRCPDAVVRHDYTEGSFVPKGMFDLIWCTEFVEHVAEQYVANYMVTMQAGKYVLITHALPGQGGHHHVNCQLPEYWIAVFREFGFEHLPRESEIARRLGKLDGAYYIAATGTIFRRLGGSQ